MKSTVKSESSNKNAKNTDNTDNTCEAKTWISTNPSLLSCSTAALGKNLREIFSFGDFFKKNEENLITHNLSQHLMLLLEQKNSNVLMLQKIPALI